MTITKPDPKEVERRAQAEYEKQAQEYNYPQISWSRRCEVLKNVYRDAAIRAIAKESMA